MSQPSGPPTLLKLPEDPLLNVLAAAPAQRLVARTVCKRLRDLVDQKLRPLTLTISRTGVDEVTSAWLIRHAAATASIHPSPKNDDLSCKYGEITLSCRHAIRNGSPILGAIAVALEQEPRLHLALELRTRGSELAAVCGQWSEALRRCRSRSQAAACRALRLRIDIGSRDDELRILCEQMSLSNRNREGDERAIVLIVDGLCLRNGGRISQDAVRAGGQLARALCLCGSMTTLDLR